MNDQGGAQFRIDSRPATRPAPSAAVTVTGSGGERYLVASSGNGSGAYRLDLGTGRRPTASWPGSAWRPRRRTTCPTSGSTSSRPVRRCPRAASASPAPAARAVRRPARRPLAPGRAAGDATSARPTCSVRPCRSRWGRSPPRSTRSPRASRRSRSTPSTPVPSRPPTSRCGRRPSRWRWPPSRARCSTPRRGAPRAPSWRPRRPVRRARSTSGTRSATAWPRARAPTSVRAGHGDVSGGQQWVVDSGGTRYRLGGKGVETAEQARVRRLRRADHPRRVDRAVRLRAGAVHPGGDVRARRGGGDRLVRAVRSPRPAVVAAVLAAGLAAGTVLPVPPVGGRPARGRERLRP